MKPRVKNNQLKRALWITLFKLQAIQESFAAHHFVGFSHDFFFTDVKNNPWRVSFNIDFTGNKRYGKFQASLN